MPSQWAGALHRILLLGAIATLVFAACGDGEPAPDADATAAATQEAETQQTDTQQTETEQDESEQAQAEQDDSDTGMVEEEAAPEPGPVIQVVTTTNFVADWVENIGGDRVEVFSLLPLGSDPHSFQPGARDVARIADADLVLTVGLGLEAGWLTELVHNANTDESKIVALGDYIDPIEHEEMGGHDDHEDEDHEDEDHEDEDHEDEDHEDEDHGSLTGRLLIADREHAALSVLDLATEGLSSLNLDVAAPSARLYTSPSGRFVFAIARGPEDGDDRVHVFDGGVYLVPHGDHFDLVMNPVSRLSVGTTDDRPIHVSVHHGWTAIFHDGTGRVALFEEHDLEEELNEYEPAWLEAGLQHGAVVPLGEDFFAVTFANPDYPETAQSSLPLGVEVWNIDGEVVYDASARECPGLHGEAAGSHGVVFGCTGGVLFIEGHDGEYEHEFISNPAEMNQAARIGTVWGHEDSENFFGSASYTQDGERLSDGLWLIEAEHGEMARVLEGTVASAAFDGHGEELFALTYDGMLHAIESGTGEVEESIQLVDAFDSDTSPSFIVVGELLYLSDRANGRIVEFSIAEGEIEREWSVMGQPGSLAFVGLGVAEAFEEHGHDEDGHDEDEEDHDEHDHDEDGHDEDEEDHDEHDHDEDEHDEHAGHDHGPLDPHFWFDPLRVKTAVNEIAARLSALDPAGTDFYSANADSYNFKLDDVHAWTLQQIAQVPIENRLLVTSHDSLSYFAELYGFLVVGTVIPVAASTDVEPTAEEMVELVHEIEEFGVGAIFGETTVSERLARAIADETGAELVRLYSGSLGEEGSDAETFIGMLRVNVDRIVAALK